MIRLHITTEGQTEQGFVRRVLAEHLAGFHVFVDARCILTSRDKRTAKEYRGGLIGYEKAKKDILAWIKEDNHPECRFTTMFDLYALPEDFPGYRGRGGPTGFSRPGKPLGARAGSASREHEPGARAGSASREHEPGAPASSRLSSVF